MDLFIVCVRTLSPSVVSDSFATLWTVAHQAPLSMGFARQEYWSGVPLPSPPITSTFYLLSLSQMSEKKSLLPTIEEEPMQHISLRVKVRLNNLP